MSLRRNFKLDEVPDEVNVLFLLNLDDTGSICISTHTVCTQIYTDDHAEGSHTSVKDVEELLYVKIWLKDRRGPGSNPQPPESL